MIYRIYGQKDTTIYELNTRKTQNTGLDEVLEVTKFFDEDSNTVFTGNSRILTQFDLTDISQSIVAGDIPTSSIYQLNLTSIENSEVQSEYTLEVYPVSQSWSEGAGQFNNTPFNQNGCSWERRSSDNLWGVGSVAILNGKDVETTPKSGVVLYESFAEGSGSAFLTESINDFNGNSPFASVVNEQLVISASNFAGTTLVFPAYLQTGFTYGVQFQIDPNSFDDVTFRIKDPNGVLKNQGDYEGMVGAITASSTQSFDLGATVTGEHELRFTFFDGSGDGSSTTGTFDEVYVYQKEGNLIVWDTFTQNEGNFKLRNRVNESANNSVRMFASQSLLNLYADDGGADAQYSVNLQAGLQYSVSASISPGDFDKIDFLIYDNNGLPLRTGITNLTSSYTANATQSISFTPAVTGDYIFAYTYYNASSSPKSGSIDDFRIEYSGSLDSPEISEAGFITNSGGATWYTSSIKNNKYSQTFTKSTSDLNVEVTEYVQDMLDGGRPNDGFLIKRPVLEESGSTKYGSSKFFSNDTHTIYVPTLEAKWDDSSFATGSLTELTADDITLYMKNLKTEYKELSRAKLRVVGRETYPQRSFTNSAPYNQIKYLPATTYYQVRDVETNLVLIPFDTTYTKVSCDSTGNFFDFRFNTLQPERFYQFEFRVDRTGNQQYFDGFIFKVVR
jgi:cell wall assembly regulator SMI1